MAGRFYPADPGELETAVRGYLAGARSAPTPPENLKAVIAPHAGYVYSGPIAGSVYAQITATAERVRRVLLLGPAHQVRVAGLAAPEVDAFATPLGRIELDREALDQALALPQVCALDAAHAHEHSLEVQLPFLQCALGDFSLVPFAVGDATAEEVAEVLELLWGGPETLIAISSDLSHYLPYAEARRLDEQTTRAIEELQPEAIGYEQACGRVPIQGLLLSARRRGLRARTLDLRSSGDTAGPRDGVVGYGAYVFG